MSQNDDHIGQEDEDPSRTLDAGKPLYELGSRIGRYKLLSVLGEGGFRMVYPLIAYRTRTILTDVWFSSEKSHEVAPEGAIRRSHRR